MITFYRLLVTFCRFYYYPHDRLFYHFLMICVGLFRICCSYSKTGNQRIVPTYTNFNQWSCCLHSDYTTLQYPNLSISSCTIAKHKLICLLLKMGNILQWIASSLWFVVYKVCKRIADTYVTYKCFIMISFNHVSSSTNSALLSNPLLLGKHARGKKKDHETVVLWVVWRIIMHSYVHICWTQIQQFCFID